MIELLIKYARDHQLVVEPGFKSKTIRWSLHFEGDQFADVIELGDTTEKKNAGETFPKCPDLSQPELIAGKGHFRCHFLAESADVVALVNKGEASNTEKAEGKHEFFLEMLHKASSVMPELEIIAGALEDEAALQRIQEKILAHKIKPTDKITFHMDSDCVLDRQEWHDWWRTFRKQLKGNNLHSTELTPSIKKTAPKMLDITSGEWETPTKTHLKIEGLSNVGGLSSNSSLISFGRDSFNSFGLEQSANAAMSEENAAAYRVALNELIANHSVRISRTKTIYWFSRMVPSKDNPLLWMDTGETEDSISASEEKSLIKKARELLESIAAGKRSDLRDCEYFASTLSGAVGRVMIRDWMEGSFETLAVNIYQWFNDLSIISKEGERNIKSPKLYSILASSIRDMKDFPPNLEARIWRAAINHEPIPGEFVSMILREITRKLVADGSVYPVRYGVLKAYLIRKGDHTMINCLNEEHPDAAYHCGRLLAVLGNLQSAALGSVNAGVIQKYYASASITPALVLGRLTRTSQFHLNKLSGGLAHIYESKIANIWSKICDNLPVTLSLEEQSLFALGYYHQIAADNEEKMKRSAEKKNKSNQPDEKEENNNE